MARRYLTGLMGGAVAMLAILPPAAGVGPRLLTLQVFSQMLLLAVAAPLLVHVLPSRLAGRLRWHPAVCLLTFNAIFLGWLFPPVHDALNRSAGLRVTAQLVFLLAAMGFWWPVMRPDGLSRIAKIGYLLVAGVPPTIPGVLLGFSHRVIYASYAQPGSGPGPLEDQQLAGLLLFGTAKLVLITVTFAILWRMLTPETEPPDDDHDQASVPELPPRAPAWLTRLGNFDLPAEPVPAQRRIPVLPAG
jgi:cytochrome c oxidase assembly factor CtaG